MTIINSFAEQKAQEALSLSIFKGFDLEKTKEVLSDMLADIGKHGLFTEYTKHDITHVDGMLKLLEFIIPEKTRGVLTPTDWMLIVLSIYFHDLGMLITRNEFAACDENDDYQKFLRSYDKEFDISVTEEEKGRQRYQDYVRIHHGDRICKWIKTIGDQPETDNPISKLLYDMLHYVDENFRNDLAEICRSHSVKLSEISGKLVVDRPYAQGEENQANLLYAAAVLRTADLMHVNSERSPTTSYLLISPQDEYSRREWVKQKSVSTIRAKKEYDKDGKLDVKARIHRFEVIGNFRDASAYKSFMSYLDDAEEQLKETHEICKESMEKNQNCYDFPWDEICRDEIKPLNFSGKPLRFDLDTKNILNLLVGHTLYSQVNVVLRELAQNSIDAVRLMNKDFKEGNDDYTPTVAIEWNSEDKTLSVKDNGTGMNEDIIRKYLMKVGASRYQSEEFKKENRQFHSISRFGIGVLTCFMISDEFTITTKFSNDEKVYSIEVGGMEKEFMLRYDADPSVLINKEHGTTIVLKVREDADISDIELRLREWVVVPGCIVTFSADGEKPIEIGYNTEEAAVKGYLSSIGICCDSDNYKLDYYESGCSTIYYLLTRNKTFGYWQMCMPGKYRLDSLSPVGICIEGIRVSNLTPGFDSRKYFAFVNCKGNESPSTNVARDRLEDSPEMTEVLRSVYKAYLKTIIAQIEPFSTKYSLSWAHNNAIRQVDNLLNDRYESWGLIDKKVFDECLEDEAFMLIDNGEDYKKLSLNQLPNSIWTMENHAYSSAVSMVQEIHDCAKTPLGITKELMPNGKINVEQVYTEDYFTHYLNELFLKTYQVKEIDIDSSLRKIEFCWERGGDYWNCIEINSGRHSLGSIRLFVQKSDQLKINAEQDEIAIKSNVGYFLLANNCLCEKINRLVNSDDEKASTVINILSELAVTLIGRIGKFDEKEIDKFFNSANNSLRDEIWNLIGSKNDFYEMLKRLSFKKVDFSKYYITETYI